ncbi:glycosyltransferase [Rhodococcus sp. BP-241]|uniref:glycosyltransferase n=1 Tax=Rhodococcus sp. BP-241 TaxID=2739441 RepID=UPI001C9A4ACC|nr:glycosyltransferase [Rhodococcus sp. BP-241]MBY6706739.1 glycosyltransferase [Rhodococcus sp. BP-241]
MRIAMVSEHSSPLAAPGGIDAGGQSVHVGCLAVALVDRGHEVSVFTRRDSREQPDEVVVDEGYRVVHVPAGPPEPVPRDELLPYMGDFASHLSERWTRDRPDVVHAHYWMSGFATQLAACPLAIPTVVTFHALGVVKRRHQGTRDTSPPSRPKIERLIARGADHVVATCSDEVTELVRMGIPRRRVSVVPCGVDLEKFQPAPVSSPGPARRRRLVAVGRLVPRKGFDLMIAALASIPDTDLIIAGGERSDVSDDDEARRLKQIAIAHGVADRVRLVGQVSREAMPDLLRSADIVVCTPTYEPFGIVPLEAMACGIPVVATAVGGFLDTVIDGVTGVLVHRRTPAAVADAVRRLLNDEGRRTGYGMSAADRARARYSWEQIAVDTDRVYRSLLPEPTSTDTADVSGDDQLDRV